MEGMFQSATIFNQYIGYNLVTGAWNVSNVVNMKLMFYTATTFNRDISNWNVGNVRTMNSMFMFADNFIQNIGIWNVGNVRDMAYMFYGLGSFNLDISGWDVHNVTNMEFMLYNTPSFNQDISGWDVSSVTKMNAMFTSATSFNKNIRHWPVNPSTDLTNMFDSATAFQAAFYIGHNYPGYNPTIGDPNTPLYTFFNYSPPPPPPPPIPNTSGIRGGVGGGGGAFWFGVDGFLYKRKAAGGCRRSTKMGAGGNALCNNSTYIYNKFKPGGGGVGASSIANRRAKSRLATVCNTQRCFPCYNTLGQYSNYTHNPNGFVPCPGTPK
jgi:surface protein